MRRIKPAFFLIFIVSPLFAAPALVNLTRLAVQQKWTLTVNVKLNFIHIHNKKNDLRLFYTVPYLRQGGKVYYLNEIPRKGAHGEWLISDILSKRIENFMKTGGKVKSQKKIKKEEFITGDNKRLKIIHVTSNKIKQHDHKKREKLSKTNEIKKKTFEENDKKSEKRYNKSGFIPLDAVIIDPGHGGKDPGAIAPNGLQEKRVVLAVAKELRRLFQKDGRYRVYMTRKGDYFVTLENRTGFSSRIAKKYHPLFVSIHANITLNRKISGVEVFSLADKASDDTALAVETMENQGFNQRDVEKTDALFSILADLLREGLKKESAVLSKMVLNSVVKITGAKKRGAKKANFYVLKYNTVPSILIETGFLSNKREVKNLASTAYRKKIAKGIYKGIIRYIKKYNETKGLSK